LNPSRQRCGQITRLANPSIIPVSRSLGKRHQALIHLGEEGAHLRLAMLDRRHARGDVSRMSIELFIQVGLIGQRLRLAREFRLLAREFRLLARELLLLAAQFLLLAVEYLGVSVERFRHASIDPILLLGEPA
jgi:hypothetical protein